MVKDLALSLLWLRFEPWPRKFTCCGCAKKKKKKKKKGRGRNARITPGKSNPSYSSRHPVVCKCGGGMLFL